MSPPKRPVRPITSRSKSAASGGKVTVIPSSSLPHAPPAAPPGGAAAAAASTTHIHITTGTGASSGSPGKKRSPKKAGRSASSKTAGAPAAPGPSKPRTGRKRQQHLKPATAKPPASAPGGSGSPAKPPVKSSARPPAKPLISSSKTKPGFFRSNWKRIATGAAIGATAATLAVGPARDFKRNYGFSTDRFKGIARKVERTDNRLAGSITVGQTFRIKQDLQGRVTGFGRGMIAKDAVAFTNPAPTMPKADLPTAAGAAGGAAAGGFFTGLFARVFGKRKQPFKKSP